MVDVLSLVFKLFSQQQLSDTQIFSKNSVLVLGNEDINRSVLLSAALTAAAHLGLKVLFFTQSQIQSLPVSFQGLSSTAVNPDCLKKIKFIYPKTLEELLEDVASLHELVSEAAALPALIVVDGLERYLCDQTGQDRPQQEAQSSAAHLVALLHDTAAFLTQNLQENQAQCRVIVSIQSEWKSQGGCDTASSDPVLSVVERYLQVRCTIENEVPNEWSLYLSGPGLQVDEDGYKEGYLQWRVVLQPSGSLEFCPVASNAEASQNRDAVSSITV